MRGILFAALLLVFLPRVQAQSATAPVIQSIDETGLAALRVNAKGSVLVLNFWATWCKPCVEEFPDLLRLRSKYSPRGLRLAFVSIDDDPRARQKVSSFLKRMKVSFPTYLKKSTDDETFINAVDSSWSGALPATFIFDGKGKLIWKKFEETSFEELESKVKDKL